VGQKQELGCKRKKDGNVELAKLFTDSASIEEAGKSPDRTQFQRRNPFAVVAFAIENSVPVLPAREQ
jgi:hypothetical protein